MCFDTYINERLNMACTDKESLQSIQTEIIHQSKIGKYKNGVIPHKKFITIYYLCRADQITYMKMIVTFI